MNVFRIFVMTLLLMSVCSTKLIAAEPCGTNEHRQFDFWLGQWTAYDKDGVKLGTNHLRSVIGNCGLEENWVGASGQYEGTSYNIFVPSTKSWRQIWIDNQGGALFLEGQFENGKMQLQGSRTDNQGEQMLDRITWTPLEDGRVRQQWQSSDDKGKTWTEVFDGYYVRDE